jgi:hypothetical protein
MRLNFVFHTIFFLLILNILEHLLQYITDVRSLEGKKSGFFGCTQYFEIILLKYGYWSQNRI